MSRKIRAIEQRIEAIEYADTDNFVELVKIAKLDSSKSFRHKNLSGVDFSNCDLSGYDIRGSKIAGANFNGAKIAKAVFDKRQLMRPELKLAIDYDEFRLNQISSRKHRAIA